jgi:hypothetical protein
MQGEFFACRSSTTGKHRGNTARNLSIQRRTYFGLDIKLTLPPASGAICASSSTEIGASHSRMRYHDRACPQKWTYGGLCKQRNDTKSYAPHVITFPCVGATNDCYVLSKEA